MRSQYLILFWEISTCALFSGDPITHWVLDIAFSGEAELSLLKKSCGNILLGTLSLMERDRSGDPVLIAIYINIIAQINPSGIDIIYLGIRIMYPPRKGNDSSSRNKSNSSSGYASPSHRDMTKVSKILENAKKY